MSEFNSEEEFLEFLAKGNSKDPLFATKMGANHFLDHLMNFINRDGDGVHVETLIGIVASMGGYACQLAATEQSPAPLLMKVSGKDGKTYFFGDAINKPLFEDDYSYCNLVMAAVVEHNVVTFPNMREISEHVAATAGSEEFGIPRLPEDHALHMPPGYLLENLWPMASDFLEQYRVPAQNWPLFFGLATQNAIGMAAEVLDPSISFKIAVECAIPMSKINPDEYKLKKPIIPAWPELNSF